MVYSDGLSNPSMVELARTGNFQAIAHWISQALSPYGIRIYVGAIRPGYLKVLVELPVLKERNLPEQWRDYLVRFVCHRIWQLNSAVIEGARIAARFADEPQKILWEQSVRVISPARRQRQQQSQTLRSRVRHASRRKTQLKTMRSLLMSGTPVFAFAVGCVLGFSKAPVEQTNAASAPRDPQPQKNDKAKPQRATSVRAAMEVIPVVPHNRVPNPNDATVTLMFGGDVTLADAFADAVGNNYGHAFAAMPEYRDADVAMVNLENPLTKATLPLPDKQFNFKADPESVKVLTEGGVDLVTLANNHTMDFQKEGLLETMATLDQAGILHLGAGRDEQEARRPEIIEVKGQRVAYLGYYGADFHAAGPNHAGTNYADEARIAADIKSIRDQVDWIVVNYHWGEELATHPADWQVDLAHFTIDQGADLVVGHHPHVLQGAEIYQGRPIAYSLGNFIFGGNSRKDYETAVLKVALNDKQMKVEFLPVEVRNYQPQVAAGDRGTAILRQLEDRSNGFKQPLRSPAILDARSTPKPATTSPNPATTPPPELTAPTTTPLDTVTPPTTPPTVPAPVAPADSITPPADPFAPTIAPNPLTDTPSPTTEPPLSPDGITPVAPTPDESPLLPVVPDPPANDSAVPSQPTSPIDSGPSTNPALPLDTTAPTVSPDSPPSYYPGDDTQMAPEADYTNTAPMGDGMGMPPVDRGGSFGNPSDVVQPPPHAADPPAAPGLIDSGDPSAPAIGGEADPVPASPDFSSDEGANSPSSTSPQQFIQPTDSFVNDPTQTPIHPVSPSPQPVMPDSSVPAEVPDVSHQPSSEQAQAELAQEELALKELSASRPVTAAMPQPNELPLEVDTAVPSTDVAFVAANIW